MFKDGALKVLDSVEPAISVRALKNLLGKWITKLRNPSMLFPIVQEQPAHTMTRLWEMTAITPHSPCGAVWSNTRYEVGEYQPQNQCEKYATARKLHWGLLLCCVAREAGDKSTAYSLF